MDLATAADKFLAWAASFGAYNPDLGMPIPVVSDYSDFAAISEAGKTLLKTKLITSVAKNESSKELIVFTRRVAPSTKKDLAKLPSRLDDVGIIYRQGSIVPIDSSPTQPTNAATYQVRSIQARERYCCGSSVSVGNNREAGTFGALVRDAAGQFFGLSNNHVTGGCSHAGVGLPILAPGIIDIIPGCLTPFTVGFHERSLPFFSGTPDNINSAANCDAALFKIADPDAVSSFQGIMHDTPSTAQALVAGMRVEKVGRTTGHTVGTVLGELHGPLAISYQANIYGFSGKVYFQPLFVINGIGALFSDSGDSGSLITALNAANERVGVGLVVGKMVDGTAVGGFSSLVLPIERILNELQVTLVSGHNI